jgi:4'-phosphopantetheinyl transferase
MTTVSPIEVELWVWSLDVDEAERGRLFAYLSEDEVARALRFVFDRDRQRYVVARGRMREILARVLGVTADALRFSYSSHGKPSLSAASAPLHFNLSHSEGLAALGVSRARELGVDVEHVRPLKEDIAERFFSRGEVAALRALPEDQQLAAFYRCWTRKEAVVKAIGEGLSRPLDSFDVTLDPDAAHLLRMDGDADGPHVWQLAHFAPVPGFAGAVACRTGGGALVVKRREV